MPEGFKKNVGTRTEVYHGVAKKTSGGLHKEDLTLNRWGRIVSVKRQEMGRVLYNKYEQQMVANKAPSYVAGGDRKPSGGGAKSSKGSSAADSKGNKVSSAVAAAAYNSSSLRRRRPLRK